MIKKDYSDPTNLFNILAAIDRKDYNYYDNLTEEQQKEVAPYLLMRWMASVEGNGDISKYYVISTNEFLNNNFWDLSKNKKFMWLNLCACSPGIGKQRHYWLGNNKKDNTSPLKKIILELLPNAKVEDIDLIIELNSEEKVFEWLEQQGLENQKLTELKKKK